MAAASPTPSLDSIRGANSIESYGEHNGYLSDSPLTLSGSSPPVSDSVICEEYTTNNGNTNQHHPISASISSASSSSSSSNSSTSSGVSGCGSTGSDLNSQNLNGNNISGNNTNGPGVIGSNLQGKTNSICGNGGNSGSGSDSGKDSPCSGILSTASSIGIGGSIGIGVGVGGILNVPATTPTTTTTATINNLSGAPRCTACKSKQSDAVAKCFECVSFLCASCVTAHQFMHCFSGHNVCLINNGYDNNTGGGGGGGISGSVVGNTQPAALTTSIETPSNPAATDFKFSSSLTMMIQQQQQQQQQQQNQLQKQQPMTQLSKIVLAASGGNNGSSGGFIDEHHNIDQKHNEDYLSSLLALPPPIRAQQPLFCPRHKHELLKYNCRTCCALVCKDCIAAEHQSGLHELELLQHDPQQLPTQQQQQQQQQQHQQQLQMQNNSESIVQSVLADLRGKVGEMVSMVGNSDSNMTKMKKQHQKAHNEINETYQFFCSMLDERKQELFKELESLYNTKVTSNNIWLQRSKELIEKAMQSCDAIERSASTKSVAELLMMRKTIEMQLHSTLQEMQMPSDLEFVSNYQSIQAGVRNTFGYIRATNGDHLISNGMGLGLGLSGVGVGCGIGIGQKQPPIARPTQSSSASSASSNSSGNSGGNNGSQHLPSGLGFSTNLLDSNSYGVNAAINGASNGSSSNNNNNNNNNSNNNGIGAGVSMGLGGIVGRGSNHQLLNGNGSGGVSGVFDDLLPKRFQTSGSTSSAVTPFVSGVGGINPYEKWSNGGADNLFTTGSADPFAHSAQLLNSLAVNGGGGNSLISSATAAAINAANGGANNVTSDSLLDLTSKLIYAASINPPKSQIKRQKMIYHCKFGEFGVMEGQFTEPSGVAVNAQNDIIVADTNNHRIQIFDKEGRFKFQFGECGKRDSQLLYPNRVAVVRTSGDIIVTERSPTHQIQIYNQYGQFVRKFGANILQHPRGVTVDNKGRIIVVECKVMRVIIFDQSGNVLHKFGCSKHLEFPNGVVVNDKQEIFISDNRAHCVKVFNYEGQYLRQIGGEGVTNYPIGVGINANGEILIADNHNNFNLTIFTQDGQLVSALESKVKHAQCFDVSLMDDGSVVLASKDYRLYIYRYVQVPPVGL